MTDAKQERLPGLDSSGIIRVEKRERWLTIENGTVRDKRLTFGARGLLAYLLSHADKWEIKVNHLIRQSPAGRDAIYSLLRELEKFRYLIRKQRRGNKGRYYWLSVVYETPQGPPLTDEELRQLRGGKRKKKQGADPPLPFTGNPDMDEPDTVKPDTERPDTDKPDTDKPDTERPDDKSFNQSPTDEVSNQEILLKRAGSEFLGTASSSIEEIDDEGAKEVLEFYSSATGNRVKHSDVSFYRERLRERDVLVVKAGIALSVCRAFEANAPTRIGSLAYCLGAIEELSEPHVERRYLVKTIGSLDQDFSDAAGRVIFERMGLRSRTIREGYQERLKREGRP